MPRAYHGEFVGFGAANSPELLALKKNLSTDVGYLTAPLCTSALQSVVSGYVYHLLFPKYRL